MSATAHRRVRRLRAGRLTAGSDVVVTEEPLELVLDETPIAVLMRTPGDEADLVRGFALTEGVVLRPDELGAPKPLGSGRWAITLAPGVEVDPERFRRNLYATSSCGICGKASIDAVRIAAAAPPPGPVVSLERLLDLPRVLAEHQVTFAVTGGLHAAGVFLPNARPLAVREDIGRHNAVDKAVGAASRTRWPLAGAVLAVSGRVSFEIVQKAAVAGVPVVAGISAVSSLAVDLADELGITVVGFLRDGGANVYSAPDRVERTTTAPR